MNKFNENIFYHIYPIGFCDAYEKVEGVAYSLKKIYKWVEHMSYLGINSLYIGPLFESSYHGYDTIDYYNVDRRLGDNDYFKDLVRYLHDKGIKVVVDGVFNHVSRDFFAFKDVINNRENSQYRDWFDVDFGGNNHYKDGLSYEAWNGCLELVKLNLRNEDVKNYLYNAISYWIEYFDIDGIRLDAADCIDFDFFRGMRNLCDSKKDDFILIGEVIHGDYSGYVKEAKLDSVTNYECFKGIYSSLNDVNYFEIAYSLNRQFANGGMYKDISMYSFLDNHDVNRIMTNLKNERDAYNAYALLFTIPGIPSIYYGSEFAIKGVKDNEDRIIRPSLDIDELNNNGDISLLNHIKKLIDIRKYSDALKYGEYEQVYINNDSFVFKRSYKGEISIVAFNTSNETKYIDIDVNENCKFYDILNYNEEYIVKNNRLNIKVYPYYTSILTNK